MDLQALKDRIAKLRTHQYYAPLGELRGIAIYASNFYASNDEFIYSGYIYTDGVKDWTRLEVKLQDLTEQEYESINSAISKRFPDNFEVTRDRYLIEFKNIETGESMVCNLKDQKFTKIYKTGKERDIKYPHSFFRGLISSFLVEKIPTEGHFKKLMEVIIAKEYQCSNFGTFLVRMFDNIHLESYVAVGKPFDNRISVPYNYFPKDVRKVLDELGTKYTQETQQFFMNMDTGKAFFSIIKDLPNFKDAFEYLAYNMSYLAPLVENYNYNVKSLFNYLDKRNWRSNPERSFNKKFEKYNADLPNYFADYARMASEVYSSDFIERTTLVKAESDDADAEHNSDFPKYPKDLKRMHDYVAVLHASIKERIDEEKFKKIIKKKYEFEKGEYCMVNAESSLSVRLEGTSLGHCVGTYVKRMTEGNTYIIFLRKKDAKETPLVTVEILGTRINQVRGQSNREPNYDERVFLQEFAKAKGLVYTGGRYY